MNEELENAILACAQAHREWKSASHYAQSYAEKANADIPNAAAVFTAVRRYRDRLYQEWREARRAVALLQMRQQGLLESECDQE